MATYTPNLNLGKPEATDPFGNFRQLFNDNMDILDNGGGGGSSSLAGLTDVNLTTPTDGQVLTYDNNNSKWVNANPSGGGGGSFFGCAIDENNKLFEGTINNFNQSLSYTATEDGIALCWYKGSVGTWQFLVVNGVMLRLGGNGTDQPVSYSVPIRKGDVVSARYQSGSESCYFWLSVYGIKQGTSGIFAPVIYSDTERKIGIWRDNKPLYQRILTLTQDTALVADTWVKTEFNKNTMETLVRVDASIGTSGAVIEALSGGFIDGKLALNSARNVGLNVSDNARIIVQYTKTTDVAGSGDWNTDGVPTVHYDTSEKVIGTWYNGKPIYRKVLTPTVNAGSNTLAHGISDLDECISIRGMCKYNNTSDTLPMPYVSTNINYMITLGNVNASNYLIETGIGFSSIQNAKVIIEYTKTTD